MLIIPSSNLKKIESFTHFLRHTHDKGYIRSAIIDLKAQAG